MDLKEEKPEDEINKVENPSDNILADDNNEMPNIENANDGKDKNDEEEIENPNDNLGIENLDDMHKCILEVDPSLKDVVVENFAQFSLKVLSEKLKTYNHVEFTSALKIEDVADALKELFTTGRFIVISEDQINKMLEDLKVTIDLNVTASNIYAELNESSDDFEINFINYLNKDPTEKLIVIDLNNELKLYNVKNQEPIDSQEPKLDPMPMPEEKSINFGPDNEFERTLIQTIENYEALLIKQKSNGEDTSHITELLINLKKQLPSHEKPKTRAKNFGQSVLSSMTSNYMKPKDRRIKALDEIFHFYTRQLALADVRKTFDMLQNEMDSMTLGYYIKFLKDFKVEFELQVLKKTNRRN